ncbi:MAG: antitoxin MazE-like protein [Rhodomicrobium sp.]
MAERDRKAVKSNKRAIQHKQTAKARPFRLRMSAAGLRPVRIWVPDTRAEGFAEKCAAQAAAIARRDPAGEELQRFIDAAYEWPE